jgi:hypothetical protein
MLACSAVVISSQVRASTLLTVSRLSFLAASLVVASGCSDPDAVTFDLTLGYEQGAFQAPPPVTRIDVEALDANGALVSGVSTAPGGSFELGDVSKDQFVQVHVKGFDATGVLQARGRSVGTVVGDIASDVFPVFVQRLDQWARPPSGLLRTHVGGVGGAIGERFLMLTGGTSIDGAASGSDSTLAFYDLLALGGSMGGTLDRVPESLVLSADGGAALFIDAAGALWLDFAERTSKPMDPPDGLSFAEVAGGRTIDTPSVSYVVGATRRGAPSDKILVVAADGSLSAASLSAPRQGAAAAWLEDSGLVVTGGSATAPGVEVLIAGNTMTKTLGFDPDPVSGAGAVAALGSDEVLLLCGTDGGGQPAPVRVFDASCNQLCMSAELSIDLGVALDDCRAFTLGSGELLVVGSQLSDGLMRALFVNLSSSNARDVPFKEPRSGATVVSTPLGGLALLGGVHADGSPAFTVETLFPQ